MIIKNVTTYTNKMHFQIAAYLCIDIRKKKVCQTPRQILKSNIETDKKFMKAWIILYHDKKSIHFSNLLKFE